MKNCDTNNPVRVLILARYGALGASSRVRHYSYIKALQERGFQIETHALIDDDSLSRFYEGKIRRWDYILQAYWARARLALRLADFDLIWIEKEAMPGLPWFFERAFYERPNAHTIIDMDDFWLERFALKNSTRRRVNPRIKAETRKQKRMISSAHAVTAANPALASTIELSTGVEVHTLPNCIDVDEYARAGEAYDHARIGSSHPKVRIGWIGTPYTASVYLPDLVPVLNRLSREGIAEIILIGSGAAVPDLVATRLRWAIETEVSLVASLDIGIMPLGSSSFDLHKSGWKLYQYMAAGRCVVASNVGFNTELVENGASGFLVDDVQQFEDRLRELAANPALRQRFGQAGQRLIQDRFRIEFGTDALENLFRSLLQAS